jgi:hypothetical protein
LALKSVALVVVLLNAAIPRNKKATPDYQERPYPLQQPPFHKTQIIMGASRQMDKSEKDAKQKN